MPRKKTADIIEPQPAKPFVPDAPVTYNKKGFAVSTDKGLIHIDKKKNKIIINGNSIKIFLSQSGYKLHQHLFTVNLPRKQLVTERDYLLHLHKKLKCYSFNYWVLVKAKKCTHLLIKEVRFQQVNKYIIPIKDALHKGKIKMKNHEKSIVYIDLNLLETYKITKEAKL